MVLVKKEGVILEATDLKFENKAVFNPTIIQEENTLHMFYRAVDKNKVSSIGYCKLDGPLKVIYRKKKPILFSEFDYEKRGLEDPRIVKVGKTYYIFYIAYDGTTALVQYAVSRDLKTWKKKGLISPKIKYADVREMFEKSKLKKRYFSFVSFYKKKNTEDALLWEKDIFLFPKKINGKYALIHRVLPGIQVIYFDKFKDLTQSFWIRYFKKIQSHIILEPRYWFESSHIGGGCVPIETSMGWLLIYHSVQEKKSGNIYRTGIALLDRHNPCKVIGHLEQPLFGPEAKWEVEGNVKNVVFPSGTAIFGDTLYIYYGAADQRIAVISLNINELLQKLISKKV